MIASLVNHLWQSTLFALAVAVLVHMLRDDAARIRYTLWLAASVKFLVPFSLLAALGARLAPSAEMPAALTVAWPNALERLAEPVGPESLPAPLVLGLLAVWVAGMVAVMWRWLLNARALAAHVQGAAAEAAADDIRAARTAGSLRSSIPIRYSSARLEPALVGIWRPVLVLPQDVEERLSPGQLDAVIEHELCHLRRRDNLTACVHMLVEALFWFHPLVWWIGSRLLHERERACDEAVVEAGHDRRDYAEAILNVAELSVASPIKCAAGVGGADLKSRITAVMRRQAMKELGMPKKLLLNFGALSALAVPVAFGWLTASISALAQDQEYLPVVKVAPVYPEEAAALRLEGYVVVEFTVTENGGVEDLFVVESSSAVFEEAALDAVRKFKYLPRTIDGQAVSVPGVRNKITFVLEESEFAAEQDGSLQQRFARSEGA